MQYDLDKDLTIDPPEIMEDINVDDIEMAAQDAAFAMCKNLREVYFDEEYMRKNPQFKKRLDVELESLRVLIKMRKSDEIVHDLCLKSVGLNTNNASLYKALTGIQASMMNIQKQMDETVRNINTLLKNVQLEINFEQENKNEETPVSKDITRGTKKFIEQMNQELNDAPPMFEDELPLFEQTMDEENEQL